MKVILMRDVIHAGRRGDIIDVKPGHARNFLLPQGMALEATPANLRVFEQQRSKIEERHFELVEQAREVAAGLNGLLIEIKKRVGETETLYGSVTATEISDQLEAKGIELDKRRIDLEGGIKTVGDHEVRIDLHQEVVATITVRVVAEE